MHITEKPKAIIVFSGGQDSTTCLYKAISDGYVPLALTINYGQRHSREVAAAEQIARLAGVQHQVVNVGPILRGSSPLVSGGRLEQYANHQSLPGGLEKTFVPMRNQFFLTIAANYAHEAGTNVMYTGVCEEDYGGYPDCRRVFIDALEEASSLGSFNEETGFLEGLKIMTPLMYLTKAFSVSLALSLEGCYGALAFSHTAYDGAYPPVGHDHATLLRAKGFEEAGVPDPLILRAVYIDNVMDLPSTPNYSNGLVDKFMPLVRAAADQL